ncbi:helix-turn-helix transcriptional regulator [Actinacidiphila guanduensis]|uniref:Homeodomain-like domain-containing protein n=1 Tax=Actinacidiphila guanduensis TaxID=310781 RepID=A0A1H0IQ37_9ACTN|nr:helix-turn-helix transcriptional regulator [Actinacidiphila guanduensis]SDO33442.1 Homeodomain-like domain-containing protein [Actinacidiphila guanduensis]
MLIALGLEPEAEAVYRALLERREEGVAQLSGRLGLTEPQVRGALDRLSELSLVRGSYEAPGRLYAVSPEVGLEVLLARQQAELAAQQQRIDASRAAAAQLIAEHAAVRPAEGPGVEQLAGLDAIRDRLVRLTRQVRQEVMTFAPDGEHTAESIAAARPLNEELLGRGVRIRSVHLDSVRNSPHTQEYLEWLAERGGRVRTVATLPLRMIIIDRTHAVIPADSENSAAGAVVLSGQGTLVALCALFETVWQAARRIGDSERRGPGELTDTEEAAVKLLAEGYTDEAIAKRLGVSPRTARRVAGGLMHRLDARSRFEAGVRAVQSGWIR